jgi:hypothetical protein
MLRNTGKMCTEMRLPAMSDGSIERESVVELLWSLDGLFGVQRVSVGMRCSYWTVCQRRGRGVGTHFRTEVWC